MADDRKKDDLPSPVHPAIFLGAVAARNLAARGDDLPKRAMEHAERLRAKGASEGVIWAETNKMLAGTDYAGVSYGADGKPRFELTDHTSRVRPGALDKSGHGFQGEFLVHPKLYDAMPEARFLEVQKGGQGSGGYTGDKVLIGDRHFAKTALLGRPQAKPTARGVNLHELQHHVQDVEEFAPGGSPRDFEKQFPGPQNESTRRGMYLSLAGEDEAENTRGRANLTAEERRQIHPTRTAKLKRSEQIVTDRHGAIQEMADDSSGLRGTQNPENLKAILDNQAAKVQTLEQFAKERGLVTTADVQSHIHAGLRSAPDSKAHKRRYEKELQRLQNERDATTKAYQDAVARGEVRDLTPAERLAKAAEGHPDNPSTQAAQRVLEKRKARGALPASGTHDIDVRGVTTEYRADATGDPFKFKSRTHQNIGYGDDGYPKAAIIHANTLEEYEAKVAAAQKAMKGGEAKAAQIRRAAEVRIGDNGGPTGRPNRRLVREYRQRFESARGRGSSNPPEAWKKVAADLAADTRLSKNDLHLISRGALLPGGGLMDEGYTKVLSEAVKKNPGWSDEARVASAESRGVAKPGEAKPKDPRTSAAVERAIARANENAKKPQTSTLLPKPETVAEPKATDAQPVRKTGWKPTAQWSDAEKWVMHPNGEKTISKSFIRAYEAEIRDIPSSDPTKSLKAEHAKILAGTRWRADGTAYVPALLEAAEAETKRQQAEAAAQTTRGRKAGPTVAELKAEAKAAGIKGVSKMTKAALMKALDKTGAIAMVAAPAVAGLVAFDAARSEAKASGASDSEAKMQGVAQGAVAATVTGGVMYAVGKGVGLGVKALAKVAPAAAGPAGVALAVGLTGLAAYKAYQAHGAKGAALSVIGAEGLLDLGKGQPQAPTQGRLTPEQAATYAAAAKRYAAMKEAAAAEPEKRPRGWSNAARIAAAKARGAEVPYGGHAEQGPPQWAPSVSTTDVAAAMKKAS